MLPSTALMLGIPAQVAGCQEVILATPPKQDGSVSLEILYIAKKVGVSKIVLAGNKVTEISLFMLAYFDLVISPRGLLISGILVTGRSE